MNNERYASTLFRSEVFGFEAKKQKENVVKSITVHNTEEVDNIDDFTGEVIGKKDQTTTNIIHVTTSDLEFFEEKKRAGGYDLDLSFYKKDKKGQLIDKENGQVIFKSESEFWDAMLVEDVKGRMTEEYFNSFAGMEPEERYRHKLGWNPKNIFELFGYVRFGERKDAAGNTVSLIKSSYKQHFMKLLNYRVNAKPKEHVRFLNADWVHDFYSWLKKTGQNKDVHKLSHNPFITDPKYIIKENTKLDDYGVNTFGQQIHKQMLKYINVLHDEGLIKEDFTRKIEASAFVKSAANPKGLLSIYDDNVEFIEPNEFLTLMYFDVNTLEKAILGSIKDGKQRIQKKILTNVSDKEKQKLLKDFTKKRVDELTKTRDAFILQILLGGLRVSDLIESNKKIINLNSFSLVQFNQKKTGGLIRNVILKGAESILKKYNNKVPVENEQTFNENLKDLFNLMDLKRIIHWDEITMNGSKQMKDQLCNIISTKYARGTYYVLCGAMGETLDTVIKRTGHSDKAIALKHYFAIGQNYDEKDIQKLLSIFDKKK